MIKSLVSATAFFLADVSSAGASSVSSGEVIRGSYSFATFGADTLEPTSFLLRLSSLDLFGDGDAVGIRYLNTSLMPLSFSQFESSGPSLDGTVAILFEAGDVLAPTSGPLSVLRDGSVEIVGLAGTFEVSSLSLFANEVGPSIDILRSTTVSQFERVQLVPAAIPLPEGQWLLIAALGMVFQLRNGTFFAGRRKAHLGS